MAMTVQDPATMLQGAINNLINVTNTMAYNNQCRQEQFNSLRGQLEDVQNELSDVKLKMLMHSRTLMVKVDAGMLNSRIRTDKRFDELEEQMESIEKRVGKSGIRGRFARIEEKIEELDIESRFSQIDEKIEGLGMESYFSQVDERLGRLECDLGFDLADCSQKLDELRTGTENVEALLDNVGAMASNSRLRRMHMPILPIQIWHSSESAWKIHTHNPMTIKSVYILGQQAKGVFEPSLDGRSSAMKSRAQRKALDTIAELARFHGITLLSDEWTEGTPTSIPIEEGTVDEHMEAILDQLGMRWQTVLELGAQHLQTRSQQLPSVPQARQLQELQQPRMKREANASNSEPKRRRTRSSMKEEAD